MFCVLRGVWAAVLLAVLCWRSPERTQAQTPGVFRCRAALPHDTLPYIPLLLPSGFGFWPDTAHDGTALQPPHILVVHSCYNALGGDPYNLDSMLQVFQRLDVAAHFIIDRTGKCYQLVPLNRMAYHAGQSRLWDGTEGLNRYSLGVELLVHPPDVPTQAQYRALNVLLSYLRRHLPIQLVLGHQEIAPDRKTDPWGFDWRELDWFCQPSLR